MAGEGWDLKISVGVVDEKFLEVRHGGGIPGIQRKDRQVKGQLGGGGVIHAVDDADRFHAVLF